MLIMIIAVVLVIGGLIGLKFMIAMGTKKYLATAPQPAQTVSTMKVTAQDWQQELDAVGTVRAINGADLSSEVSGIVEKISFESGSDAEAGTLLVHLRNDDDVAKLRALEATAKLAQITLDRDLKQLKAQAISQATVDSDTATLNSAKADVEAQRALVEKKVIRAPFAGRLGIRQVDIGQYLNAGASIVSLQQLDPIYVDFNLPEQNLPHIAVGQKTIARADALPGHDFDGEITSINSKIEESTRNIQVRATFKNPERKLLPGMFAHVVSVVGAPQKQLTLPQTAITFNPYGNTVFIVSKDDSGKLIATQTFVTTGKMRGDQIAILSGVKEGDEIVTSGQLKLRNGTPVIINNTVQPKDDAHPSPKDN